MHGNYYGTSRLSVEQEMKTGTDILLEIDWQGARQVKKQFPDAAGIFILPPSIAALEERLNKRGTDEPHIITRRLLAAGGEIAHAPEFEYAIINEEFNVALSELQAIVKATRAAVRPAGGPQRLAVCPAGNPRAHASLNVARHGAAGVDPYLIISYQE